MHSGSRWALRVSAALGLVYVAYVLTMKWLSRPLVVRLGPGEFLLALFCVSAFAIGLFIEEAHLANKPRDP